MKEAILTLILTIIGSVFLFPKKEDNTNVYDYSNDLTIYNVYVSGPYVKAGHLTFYQEQTVGEVINYLGFPSKPVNLLGVDFDEVIYDNMVIIIYPLENHQEESLININTITEEDLILTKLFSETISKAVIAYRKENGFFRSLDELINVKGIGEKTLEKVRPYLKV